MKVLIHIIIFTLMFEDMFSQNTPLYPIYLSSKNTIEHYITSNNGKKMDIFKEKYIEYYLLKNNHMLIKSLLVDEAEVYPNANVFINSLKYNVGGIPLFNEEQCKNVLEIEKYLPVLMQELSNEINFKINLEETNKQYYHLLDEVLIDYVTKYKTIKKIDYLLLIYFGQKIIQLSKGEIQWFLKLDVSTSQSNHEIILVNKDGYEINMMNYKASLEEAESMDVEAIISCFKLKKKITR